MFALASPAFGAGAQFDVDRQGATFEVQARAHVAAPLALAWATITDYEALPDFIPDITTSRVLERRHDGDVEHLTLEQRGALRFLFFTRPVTVRLRVEQQAPTRVVARNVTPAQGPAADELRSFAGDYLLQAEADGTSLRYHARIEPAFDLPPLIGAMLVRGTLRAQFHAMLDEIERRALVSAVPSR